MAAEGNWASHLWFTKETTWGTQVTSDIWTPFNSCPIKQVKRVYAPNVFCGVRQKRHDVVGVGFTCAGVLDIDLYGYQVNSGGSAKSIAQHLIDMVLSADSALTLDAFTLNKHEGNDPKVWEGCQMSSMVISGDASTGIVKGVFNFMAEKELTEAAPSLVATTPIYQPFLFSDATWTLGGVATPIEMFEWTVNTGLIHRNNNSLYPTVTAAGLRESTIRFQITKTAQTYDTLRRATAPTSTTGVLVIKGADQGTGAADYSQGTFSFDRMQLIEADDDHDISKDKETVLTYQILKPETTDNDIDDVWADA